MSLDRIRRDLAEVTANLQRFAEHHEPCERCSPALDGKPNLRPHSAAGWWQVWSGGICIALLSPDDIKAAGLTKEKKRVAPGRTTFRSSITPDAASAARLRRHQARHKERSDDQGQAEGHGGRRIGQRIEERAMKVGDQCMLERRFSHGSGVQHSWTTTVVRVTAKRAYLGGGDWFALDDPRREVKPRYLDYITTVASVADQSESKEP